MLSISEKPILVQANQLTQESVDNTEKLRRILSKQADQVIDYEVAQEIGKSLLEYYEILCEEVDDECSD